MVTAECRASAAHSKKPGTPLISVAVMAKSLAGAPKLLLVWPLEGRMLILDITAGILFILSSGLLFQKRFHNNPYLVVIAGLFALAAAYLTTEEIVDRAIDARMHMAHDPSQSGSATNSTTAGHGGTKIFSMSRPAPRNAALVAGAMEYDQEDFKAAFRDLRPLAATGNPAAKYFVGIMLLRGEGTSKNIPEAIEFLRASAEAGVADAQNYMAAFYRRGDHVPQDYKIALKWYRRAALQNYKNAQFNIALLYRDGHGVERDDRTAYYWAAIAADQGPPEAEKLRLLLRRNLSADQIESADREAKDFLAHSIVSNPTSVYSLAGASP
jgi:TPR repeat protein